MFENHRKSLIQQINIASKASYVYILSGQKFIKNAKNGPFWAKKSHATFLVIFKHYAAESDAEELHLSQVSNCNIPQV